MQNLNFDIKLYIYIFIYFITLFIMPNIFKNNNLAHFKKISLTLTLIFITGLITFCIYGLGKELSRYYILALTCWLFLYVNSMPNR